ncbi:MarR family winged helix-turn-helix transcriptional regulator [Microbispora bryophytorum]|uniref:MarR family winged helix-turn-helix transcriptional regulator n=1 Tax=Microbispora bryophytorum TaxID=1460882 RepID=UPI00340911E3
MDPFDDPRLTAMGLFAEVYTGLSSKIGATLAGAGLSEVDFETLLRLARSPERQLRMSDLAAQTSLSTSGITRVVDRLERDGLVERRACATDRRASYAVLSETGAERLRALLPQHIEDIEAWFTGLLTENQLADFLGALRVIRDVVRPCATAGIGEVSRAPRAKTG